MENYVYMAIDLKSFYASVECMQRNLDPLTTHLVVADPSRTEKTICLAVSPSLKAYGIPGRARLFEVVQAVKRINAERLRKCGKTAFAGSSSNSEILKAHPDYELTFEIAPPQMAKYMEISGNIYKVYLRFLAPEDMHVYSIDEVFMDVTQYLHTYKCTARELAGRMIREVLKETGITATAGIGTNMFLCKAAMDIEAKHIKPDRYGVRIAELDEQSFREKLWDHRPITDFWRVGRGIQKKLAEQNIFTMGDIARCSVGKATDYYNEELLYKLFGVNAELLIDHAWGWEPCTMKAIKEYKPESNSVGAGQVLSCGYEWDKARIVVREMADALVLDLVDKKLVTDQIVVSIEYDRENLSDPERRKKYKGPVTKDRYDREVPKHTHGTVKLNKPTSSSRRIIEGVLDFFDRSVDPALLVRRIYVTAAGVIPEAEAKAQQETAFEQMDLFTDYAAREQEDKKEAAELEKEKRMQQAMLSIKKKFGKNAIVKGTNLQEGATGMERNRQIGGHKA